MTTTLVVEDDLDSLDLLTELARALTHDVLTATDGQAALEVLSHHDVDLVITDRQMPRLDGLALVDAIRRRRGTEQLRVIMVSAHEQPQDPAATAGVDAYLTKPFGLAQLQRQIALLSVPPVLAPRPTSSEG